MDKYIDEIKAASNHELFVFPEDLEFWEGAEINAKLLGLDDVTGVYPDIFAAVEGDFWRHGLLANNDRKLFAVYSSGGSIIVYPVNNINEAADILDIKIENAKFAKLELNSNYDIIDGETGDYRCRGIQGAEAMSMKWYAGDEAWSYGEEEFDGSPVDVAE